VALADLVRMGRRHARTLGGIGRNCAGWDLRALPDGRGAAARMPAHPSTEDRVALRAPGERTTTLATAHPFPARLERLAEVGSTNDVVVGWLRAGQAEVCVAVAEHQTAGRGRLGRTWIAPPGAALLLSVGFRPVWLPPDRLWRLGAILALAMADAAEQVAGLTEGTIRLKWPNDLAVAFGASERALGGASVIGPETPIRVRKLAGILGESDGIGTADPRAVVGIGINADWPPATFPPDLRDDMTSLRDASGGRPIDGDELLAAFLDHLEPRVEALRAGWFDVAGWTDRQLTNGRHVRLELPDGRTDIVRAAGVDPLSGALLVADAEAPDGERPVLVGEIRHVRFDQAEV
jgi:BirA family transcriptional regulator, biotin operon repressor / biotin---[acetyl-CoA-carboxylase] ligase